MKLHKRYILLLSIALLLTAGFISGRFFIQRNFSTYIKNVIDLPNILMDQLPEHKDGLTQKEVNAYIEIKNQLWEETRQANLEGIDTRILIKAIIEKDQIDVTDTLQAFKAIVKHHEQELSPYMNAGFSADRISMSAITSALDYQMVLISLYMNTPIILLLCFIYVMTSYAALVFALLLFTGTCFFIKRKENLSYLLSATSKACYFSGAVLCGCTVIVNVVMDHMSYRIMRFMGSISSYNYLLLLLLSVFFVIIGAVLKALGKKKTGNA